MKNNSSNLLKQFAYIIILIILRILYFGLNNKQNKDYLAKYYNISKPTLKKWARFFQNEMSEEDWKAKRKLSLIEISLLKNQWGSETEYVLNKAQIVEKAESDYKTVAKNVKMNLTKIGISSEAWDTTSVFPPAITKRILEVLG